MALTAERAETGVSSAAVTTRVEWPGAVRTVVVTRRQQAQERSLQRWCNKLLNGRLVS